MKTLINKKTVYFVLAFVINAIELFRNDSTYEMWAMATNLTGVVIIWLVLTQIDLRKLLCPSTYVISGLSIVSLFFVSPIRYNLLPGSREGQIRVAIINIGLILIVGIYYIKQEIRKYKAINKFRKIPVVFIIWTLASIWALISRSEAIWPVWFYVIFTIFYMTVFNKQDWENLWNGVVTGSIWAFVFFQVIHTPFRPYDLVRYPGFMVNANNYALYACIVFTFSLVKIYSLYLQGKKKLLMLLYFVIGILFLEVSFMSGCRTAWGIEIIETIIFVFAVLRRKCKFSILKSVGVGISFLIAFIFLLYPTYFAIRYIPTIHPHPIWFVNEAYSEERVHSWDERESEKYVSFEEMLEANLGRFSETIGIIFNKSPFAIKAEAKEVIYIEDTVRIQGAPKSINMRLNYYNAYISKMNLRGNNTNSIDFNYIYEGEEVYHIWHSQNLWIQITYMFGIPFGILIFIVYFISFEKSVRIFKRNDSSGFNILPLMYMVLYFLYGMMEVTWLPGFLVLTMVFMVQHPQFGEKQDSSKGLINGKE